MDFIKTVFLAISALGFAIWIGIVWKAEGEDKLSEACHPVEFGTEKVQQLTRALVGYTPEWTIGARRYLQGGCYYFFSVVLQSGDDSQNISGLRK